MRERGLKFYRSSPFYLCKNVAPHAGAWIEITLSELAGVFVGSPPMRERGLKSLALSIMGHQEVAPHAGAWIEML